MPWGPSCVPLPPPGSAGSPSGSLRPPLGFPLNPLGLPQPGKESEHYGTYISNSVGDRKTSSSESSFSFGRLVVIVVILIISICLTRIIARRAIERYWPYNDWFGSPERLSIKHYPPGLIKALRNAGILYFIRLPWSQWAHGPSSFAARPHPSAAKLGWSMGHYGPQVDG